MAAPERGQGAEPKAGTLRAGRSSYTDPLCALIPGVPQRAERSVCATESSVSTAGTALLMAALSTGRGRNRAGPAAGNHNALAATEQKPAARPPTAGRPALPSLKAGPAAGCDRGEGDTSFHKFPSLRRRAGIMLTLKKQRENPTRWRLGKACDDKVVNASAKCIRSTAGKSQMKTGS